MRSRLLVTPSPPAGAPVLQTYRDRHGEVLYVVLVPR
jgi:hypothetical protein